MALPLPGRSRSSPLVLRLAFKCPYVRQCTYFKSWRYACQLHLWSQAFVTQGTTFGTYLKILTIFTNTTSLCSDTEQILALSSSRGLPLCVQMGPFFAASCAGSHAGSVRHSEHGHQPWQLCSSAPAPPCPWGASSQGTLCLDVPQCKVGIKDMTRFISLHPRRC